ncbi:MAG: EscN/YscN/HrcN family type III secretion system ATPase [Armatimonadetes bacterium]|nr:EscN/YscN/HrcN family type III secretion system ATPase [Armatimonadota bacterium]
MRGTSNIEQWARRYQARISRARLVRAHASVRSLHHWLIEATPAICYVGEMAVVRSASGRPYPALVVETSATATMLTALDHMPDVRFGADVELLGAPISVPAGQEVLGRIIDPIGRPLDGQPEPVADEYRPLFPAAPRTLPKYERPKTFWTRVRALDAFVPALVGRRFVVLGPPGTGKTLLLRMICCFAQVDAVVVGLVGERGREVLETAEALMAVRPESVVVATGPDAPPGMRRLTPYAATAIAEYLRDRGAHVLLAIDSLTRFAYAQRELGLALGELPASRAYPPSLFWSVPELLERPQAAAGPGKVTAYYSLLVTDEASPDPLIEVALASADGHIVLSRDLATRGVYPAIDVIASLSRMAQDALSAEHRSAQQAVRQWLQAYLDARDLIETGLYRVGSNKAIDSGIRLVPLLHRFLAQPYDQPAEPAQTLSALASIVREVTT